MKERALKFWVVKVKMLYNDTLGVTGQHNITTLSQLSLVTHKMLLYKHLFLRADKGLDRNVLSMIEPILGINEKRGGFDVYQVFCPKN